MTKTRNSFIFKRENSTLWLWNFSVLFCSISLASTTGRWKMAEEKPNGVKEEAKEERKENLYDVVQQLIFEPSKIKATLLPLFTEASRNYSRQLLLCFRQGSPLRRLFFISVSLSLSLWFSYNVQFIIYFWSS